jgi:hypothetical protein
MANSFDPGILKKLRVDKTSKFLIINAPDSYLELFSAHAFDTVFQPANKGEYDFVQVFGINQTELGQLVLQVKEAGKYDCIFWACYPKGGGKIKSDLKRDTVWASLELIGLRPVSQIAIDETWSALRGRPHEKVKRSA